jgi:hypothetical protein
MVLFFPMLLENNEYNQIKGLMAEAMRLFSLIFQRLSGSRPHGKAITSLTVDSNDFLNSVRKTNLG